MVTWASNDHARDWDGYGIYGRVFEGSPDRELIGTDAADRLVGGIGNDLAKGLGGADTLLGRGGNDRLYGGTDNDILKGGNGRDKLFGNADNDRLEGGKGNDQLAGGNGRDKLFGNAGADSLDGGRGVDVLKGGAGRDSFVFKKGYGKDTIKDFQDDIDTIQLDSALWSGTLNKQQVINKFADVVGDDVVFDFGRHELKIKGFIDLSELKDDIAFI